VGTCCPAEKPARIRIGSLESPESVVLLQAESAPVYGSGYLMFSREGTLMAQSFDASSRSLAGEPFRIVDGIDTEASRYASVSASTNGVLVYAKGQSIPTSRLTWLDRTGRELGTIGDAGTYPNVALSPDERTLAAAMRRGAPANTDIYRIDPTTGAQDRLTFDPGNDTAPIWSPDGERVVFQGVRSARFSLFQKAIAGTTSDDALLDGSGGTILPTDWSTDGRYLLYTHIPLGGNNDIWILPVSGERKPIAFLQTGAIETDGVFAPDGKWVAYSSSESGQPEVLIEPFPRTGGKIQISRSGGYKPLWRRDGKELYFLSRDFRFMVARIDLLNGRAETPVALFPVPHVNVFAAGRQYAVSRDGKRVLFNMRPPQTQAPLTVVVNWTATIQK
jgi:eukaryotic-like serine/threonine-protein kinase